ncbi:hypothetical protein T439DRAFT_357049 [Meredithblackwellia eburnea MCA 4105]
MLFNISGKRAYDGGFVGLLVAIAVAVSLANTVAAQATGDMAVSFTVKPAFPGWETFDTTLYGGVLVTEGLVQAAVAVMGDCSSLVFEGSGGVPYAIVVGSKIDNWTDEQVEGFFNKALGPGSTSTYTGGSQGPNNFGNANQYGLNCTAAPSITTAPPTSFTILPGPTSSGTPVIVGPLADGQVGFPKLAIAGFGVGGTFLIFLITTILYRRLKCKRTLDQQLGTHLDAPTPIVVAPFPSSLPPSYPLAPGYTPYARPLQVEEEYELYQLGPHSTRSGREDLKPELERQYHYLPRLAYGL